MWNNFFNILNKKERIILGLMSGTSADGLDVALVKVSGREENTKFELLKFKSITYSTSLKEKIIRSYNPDISTVKDIAYLNFYIAKKHAEMIKSLNWEFDLIGYHGQTVYHNPKEGYTLQIGESDILAVELNVPVIFSFRTKDVALGGEGAPITSYFDWIFFRDRKKTATLNIGGISNITYLSEKKEEIIAFDTGPGNCLIDSIANLFFNQSYDKDGNLSKKGKINEEIFNKLVSRETKYLNKKTPKTTGREIYNENYLSDLLSYNPYDLIRTLTYFTAYTIHKNLELHVPEINTLIISGGGAYNPVLIKDIKSFGYNVEIHQFIESKEAIAMTILANEFLNGINSNIVNVTGAKRECILGKLSLP
ncbi:anhydro-N-acetylmuramic acid kinase [Marinitoga hydrogenitolerans DSM 16785]|uniref:Anhydro-N-acetylmuramic acid kinase n=1 Tax=Marinitoga hydrogenitolerans (strain DSM 16785 / JCM 12826 / AT1271) TaxID=1122195 RepID=A0A1M4WG04_MARH1|nr:anhydro-N-acetylmuramic acid kinase [Marinitoga hydrogenitolerans]SHE80166.1 anhydro-N-acetylmuramic acid kinase [Marinitoga hydrogenitolerans DSM 16785]